MRKIKFVLAGNPYRPPHVICITAQGENGGGWKVICIY